MLVSAVRSRPLAPFFVLATFFLHASGAGQGMSGFCRLCRLSLQNSTECLTPTGPRHTLAKGGGQGIRRRSHRGADERDEDDVEERRARSRLPPRQGLWLHLDTAAS